MRVCVVRERERDRDRQTDRDKQADSLCLKKGDKTIKARYQLIV